MTPEGIEVALEQLRRWNRRLALWLDVPDEIHVIADEDTQIRILQRPELMSSRVEIWDADPEFIAMCPEERLRELARQGTAILKACRPPDYDLEELPETCCGRRLTQEELSKILESFEYP